jgi:hypothetical protein
MIFFTPNYPNMRTKNSYGRIRYNPKTLPANKSNIIKVVLQLGKPRADLEKLWALPTQNPLIYT